MIQRFAKPVPVLCMVAKKLFDHIYDHHGHRVTEWNQDILAPIKLQTFVDAITTRGALLKTLFGFVDGRYHVCEPTSGWYIMAIKGFTI